MPRIILAVSLAVSLCANARVRLEPVARASVDGAFAVDQSDSVATRTSVDSAAVLPTKAADAASVAPDSVVEEKLCVWLKVSVDAILACDTADAMSVAVGTALASASPAQIRCLTDRIVATRDADRILLYLDAVLRAVDAGTVDAGVADVVAVMDDTAVSRLVSDVLSLFVAEGLSAGRLSVTNDTVRAVRAEQVVAVQEQPVAASASTRAVSVPVQPASAAVSSLRVEIDVIDLLLSSGEFASRLGVIRRLVQLRRARGEDVSDLRELVTRILSGSR